MEQAEQVSQEETLQARAERYIGFIKELDPFDALDFLPSHYYVPDWRGSFALQIAAVVLQLKPSTLLVHDPFNVFHRNKDLIRKDLNLTVITISNTEQILLVDDRLVINRLAHLGKLLTDLGYDLKGIRENTVAYLKEVFTEKKADHLIRGIVLGYAIPEVIGYELKHNKSLGEKTLILTNYLKQRYPGMKYLENSRLVPLPQFPNAGLGWRVYTDSDETQRNMQYMEDAIIKSGLLVKLEEVRHNLASSYVKLCLQSVVFHLRHL